MGRTKGAVGKRTEALEAMLTRLKCNPHEKLARVANGELPCGVCRGKGKTRFQPAGEQKASGERTCQSCWGSGKEKIDPKLIAWCAAELAQYVAPKLKAIEHSGTIANGDLTDRLAEGRARIAAYKEQNKT